MRIQVTGRAPLSGSYRPSGNTNAALALTAAALLTSDSVVLHNFPETASAQSLLLQAQDLGAGVLQDTPGTVTLNAQQLARRTISQNEQDASVGSLLLVAPLLGRRQYARLELQFPLHRIRTHLEALRDLGIDISISGDAVDLKAARWDKRDVLLSQTSVTATALVMMMACCLGRETTIRNAASEPHVQDLARLLVRMGASILGIGSNLLIVEGCDLLQGAEFTLSTDYVEVASVAAICALTGGRAQIEGVPPELMRMIARVYGQLGLTLELDDEQVFIPRVEKLIMSDREEDVDLSLESAPWPGFPSDLIAMATVVATQSRGTALIHEKLFSNRLLFVDKLKAMGAQIVLADPHRAIVVGPTPLRSIYMDTPDVRTGMAMLGAALVAEGTSTIDNAEALEQSFGAVLGKLHGLGARITVE